MSSIEAFIAANRFGYGARPGELRTIAHDPHGWALAQLSTQYIRSPALAALPSTAAALKGATTLAREGRKAKDLGADAQQKMIRSAIKDLRQDFIDEAAARTRAAIDSPAPVFERFVHFWGNHFTVSATKRQSLPLAAAFERDAIRPYILGNFADMLLASTKHPAMLLYLDNARSIGPQSLAGKRRGRGLNENLAREILELHTLGVAGGYGQSDVISLAKMLTGWSADADGRGAGDGFLFMPMVHEPGDKILLGNTYRAAGQAEAESALRDIALHPATARFIATKLARHFVADQPPAHAVNALAQAYLRHKGALLPVYKTLLSLPDIWRQPLAKVKTPNDYILSVLRSTDVELSNVQLAGAYKSLNQVPFSAPSPAGWGDMAQDWMGGEALLRRIEMAQSVARAIHTRTAPMDLLDHTLGAAATDATRMAVKRAGSPAEAITLLFASPEFQRR